MYFNVYGEKVSKARFKEMINAQKNRRELISARLSRRELIRMGLLTGGGYLIAKSGLTARDAWGQVVNQAGSPPVRPFIIPMQLPPIRTRTTLSPAPTKNPNPGAGEARRIPHQGFDQFPPVDLYETHQFAADANVHPDLPLQRLWTFDGVYPAPTLVARYGRPALVRNFNNLPPIQQNGGFGVPQVTTHLHNGHTPSESDGNPCDFYDSSTKPGNSLFFYDQHYPNVLAGFASTHPPNGDINESLSTLFYHDHRVDFTAQNVYKGLIGFYLLFNQFDTGDETTGFRLPSFPQFDIPIVLADKVFAPAEDPDMPGALAFDLMNLDGILGDRFFANGQIQPFFEVKRRKYRFRLLNAGPSRFYELFLTQLTQLSKKPTIWYLANDGNLLPKPAAVPSVRIGVAERVDVIIDFSQFPAGSKVYLDNRLRQLNGQGPGFPDGEQIRPAGHPDNNLILEFRVTGGAQDESMNPRNLTLYALPDKTEAPAVTRQFKFDRLNGQWSINGQFMDCGLDFNTGEDTRGPRFTVSRNTVEHWVLENRSGNWQHPIHIHLEEHQILSRNLKNPQLVERARKDVTRLQENEVVKLFFRFRDWTGKYPLHCHNTIHEDHAMMLRWDIQDDGDTKLKP